MRWDWPTFRVTVGSGAFLSGCLFAFNAQWGPMLIAAGVLLFVAVVEFWPWLDYIDDDAIDGRRLLAQFDDEPVWPGEERRS